MESETIVAVIAIIEERIELNKYKLSRDDPDAFFIASELDHLKHVFVNMLIDLQYRC